MALPIPLTRLWPLLALPWVLVACSDSAGTSTAPCDDPDTTCQLLDVTGCDLTPGECTNSSCPDSTCTCPAGCDAWGDLTASCDCGEVPLPVDFCEAVTQDRTALEVASVHQFAFNNATAVIQASFGKPLLVDTQWYVPSTVEKVLVGLAFFTGMEVLIPVSDGLASSMEGKTMVVALSNQMPMLFEAAGKMAWHNVLAFIPLEELPGFTESDRIRRLAKTWIAEVRITAQDDYRTTFQVVDALKGTLPLTFADNWYASWQLPYPEPSDQTWIAVIEGLSPYQEGTDYFYLGTVTHFQEATEQVKEQLKHRLTLIPATEQVDPIVARRTQYTDSFKFASAPFVASSLVTGRAMECCTGAGGIYYLHETLEPLFGEMPANTFVTGGHGYYGEEECGEAYLVALDTFLDPTNLATPTFDCLAYPAAPEWEAWEPIESSVLIQTPWTSEAEANVKRWLAASFPLYQLFPVDRQVAADEVQQQPANAPWSWPLDATDALRFSTDLALITIVDATVNPSTGRHEVILSSTLTMYEYEHIPKYTMKLVFACGDPRLLQIGARWVVGLLRLDTYIPQGEMPDFDRMFLIPGAILPESEVTPQLESSLKYAQ